jgi:hypothetical protein
VTGPDTPGPQMSTNTKTTSQKLGSLKRKHKDVGVEDNCRLSRQLFLEFFGGEKLISFAFMRDSSCVAVGWLMTWYPTTHLVALELPLYSLYLALSLALAFYVTSLSRSLSLSLRSLSLSLSLSFTLALFLSLSCSLSRSRSSSLALAISLSPSLPASLP